MKKRIVSLLLAVVLVLGLMPTALAATATFDSFFDGLPVIAETEPGSPSSTKKWSVTTLDGEDVLMSGNKGKNSTSSTLQLTFISGANLTFEYKVSSEAGCDKLNITLGSTVLVQDASGEIDWTPLEVEANNQDVLTIQYTKDTSSASGADCVYVRNFSTGTPAVVTFHAGSGEGSDYTQKIYNGKGTLRANAFTCEGKVFAGWAASADSTDIAYTNGAAIETTTGMDLYALWADAVTVTFMNGETMVKTIDVAKDAPIGALNIPADLTKYGYKFAGWYDGETQLTAETVIAEAKTFAAKWNPITYTIAFDANGGEGTIDSIANVAYDANVALPSEGFTRKGYTLSGWGTYRGSSSATYTLGKTVNKLTNTDGATYTLYAAWRGNDVALTIDPNYEGAQTSTRTTAVGSNYNYNKQEDGSFKLDTLADPTRTGYIFLGWFDAAEDGTEITNQYKFTAADAGSGRTLYAHWQEGITVHFDGNGYENTISDKTVAKDKVFSSLPYTSSTYYPANKALDGWYIKNADGSFGKAVTNDTDFSALREVTLIAKWRDYQYIIKYSLKYSDKSSVTGTMADQPAPFGQDVKLAKCAYSRPGYEFAGWATSSYGSDIAYADEATINREWDGDYWDGSTDGESFQLYAVWTEAKSDEEKAADAKLAAAETAISGTYNCTWGKDTNALTMIRAKLTAAGITDVTVAMKQAEYSSYNYVGIAADGTLQYKWNENGSTPAAAGSVRPTVVLTYNDGKTDYSKESTGCLFSLPLDETKAMAALKTVADRIAAAIPATVKTADDLTSLPKYPLKAGVDAAQVDYNKSDDLELWTTASWASDPAAVIGITEVNYPYFAPYKATVSLPDTDTAVTLTLTLGYNGRDDLKETRVFTVTVKGNDQTPQTDYNALLNTVFGASDALTDPATDAVLNKSAVASDIQFPTTSDIRATAGYEGFDGKYTPVYITSSNTDVIESADVGNQARLAVYRPLPGQPDAAVTVTIKILDRPTGEGRDYANMPVLASLDIPVTVKALTRDELDEAAAFMTKVCTESVYWEGIRKANTSKDAVTGDLWSFIEIVPDGDGYKFIRNAADSKGIGVKADSIDGWELTEKYRAFRSSVPTVIASETLLRTQPEYNTPVKIDSVLTHAVYGKYYEKLKDTADGWKFAQFYKQPISAVVTVTGTTGIADPNAEKITLTVQVEGSEFDQSFTDLTGSFTCDSNAYKTAADALLAVLEESGYAYTGTPGYITSVADKNGEKLTAGDAAHGPCSGWMYTIDGKQPELSPGWGAALDQYILQTGDTVLRFYYVDCMTDDGHHTPGSNAVTVTKEATHEEAGSRTYTCAVTWCGIQVTETIPVTGHTWSEDVSYTWNERHTTCTAVRNCTADDGGEDSETANATYKVVTEPTATASGLGRWTAVFENEAFQTQTYDVTLPATGGNTSGGTTKPSGSSSKTETSTNRDGSKTVTQTRSDGVIVKTTTAANGSTGTVKTTTDAKGNTVVKAEAEVSAKAVADAKKAEMPVTAPIEVKAVESRESAPVVSLSVPKGAGTVKVEVPVTNLSSGTVAVLVKADGSEELIKTCVNGENGVIVSVQGDVTVKIVDNSKSFADTQNHWAADDVNFVASRDLFGGTGRDSFSPNSDMSRAMLWVVLARLNNEDTTAANGAWYERGQLWAQENGISDGSEPNGALTREQLVTMLWRASGSPAADGAALDGFTDTDSVSGYASDAMRWAVNAGLISGIGSTLKPHGDASRAQLATIIARYIRTVA